MTKNQRPEPVDDAKTAPPPEGTNEADVEGHVTSLREGGRPDARVHVRESDPWTSRGSSGSRRPHKP